MSAVYLIINRTNYRERAKRWHCLACKTACQTGHGTEAGAYCCFLFAVQAVVMFFTGEGNFILLFVHFHAIKGGNCICFTTEDSPKAESLQLSFSSDWMLIPLQSISCFISECAIITITCIFICLLNRFIREQDSY